MKALVKSLWNFLSSTTLTIVLAALVCLDAAWGSILCVKYAAFYGALDQAILVPWLIADGAAHLDKTLWIFILIVLIALFALNTVVCTIDKIYSIIKGRKPLRAFFPHVVHIGFLVALLGHLLGSSFGFKDSGIVVMEGEGASVESVPGLSVTLGGVDMELGTTGAPVKIATTVTISNEGGEPFTGTMGINDPLMYRGMAFYHLSHGTTPTGLVIEVDGKVNGEVGSGEGGEVVSVPFGGAFAAGGERYLFGKVYPDFATDDLGNPYSRSDEYRNPVQEIVSFSLERGFLPLRGPGAEAKVGEATVILKDYIMSEYAVISVNRDPGVWFIMVGSAILVLGMSALLIFRGERGELVKGG